MYFNAMYFTSYIIPFFLNQNNVLSNLTIKYVYIHIIHTVMLLIYLIYLINIFYYYINPLLVFISYTVLK